MLQAGDQNMIINLVKPTQELEILIYNQNPFNRIAKLQK